MNQAPETPGDGDRYFDVSEFTVRAAIEEHHYWHVHRRRVLLDALRAFSPPETSGRLIELGCGIGTVTTHLNAHGYECDYADFFEESLTIARTRAAERLGSKAADRRRFLHADLTLPLALSGYQGALLLDVIEHLPDDELALRHVRGMLDGQSGGFVMVTVPAFQMLWSPWDDMERHKRRYTKGMLRERLETAGFEVARITYFFAPLFFAALGVKAARALRSFVVPPRRASHLGELVEWRSAEPLNGIVLGAHGPERYWLGRGLGLPLGSSLLALAGVRG